MKKLIAVIICIAVIFPVAVSAGNIEYPVLNSSFVRLLGRGELTGLNSRAFNWPNSGIEFEFSGNRAEVYADKSSFDNDLYNGNYFTMAVYNGESLVRTERIKLISGWNTIYEHKTGDPALKKIMLVRSSEPCRGTISLSKLRTDSVPKASMPRERLIEFIGDSFTAGYGNSPFLSQSNDYTAQNTDNWNSYTGIVARHYNADNNVIAYQGKGVYANRNINALSDTMLHQFGYEEIYVDNSSINMSEREPHNFRKYQPQLVTIWLGTNDAAANASAEAVMGAYKKLLDNIRKNYPEAAVLCMAIPGRLYTEEIKQLAQSKEYGEDNKFYFHYVSAFGSSGIHAHPNVSEDEAIAQELIKTIDKIPNLWNKYPMGEEDTTLVSLRADYNTGKVSVFGKTGRESDYISAMVLCPGADFSNRTKEDIMYANQVTADKNGEYSFSFEVEKLYGEYSFYMNSAGTDEMQKKSFIFRNYFPKIVAEKNGKEVTKISDLESGDTLNVTLSGFETAQDFSGMLAIAQYRGSSLLKADVFDSSDDSASYGTEIKEEALILADTDKIKIIYLNKKTNAPVIGAYEIK